MQIFGKATRIIAIISKTISSDVLTALKKSGLSHVEMYTGRAPVLKGKQGLFSIFSSAPLLVNDSMEVFSIVVNPEIEDNVVNLIIKSGKLYNPGRGTVYCEDVDLVKDNELFDENKNCVLTGEQCHIYSKLAGICCIVQRGQGDAIARVVLDTGISVPSIFFGIGTGIRDKLGLLRITIPAEKEIIKFVTNSYDVDEVMNMMIDTGRIDQPGKGFIYIYNIKKGLVNTKVIHGAERSAASIEQIIMALDELKGGIEWRRREKIYEEGSIIKKTFLNKCVDLTIICNEGRSTDLVNESMAAGASGATIIKFKHVNLINTEHNNVSPARESCSMIIPETQVNDIVNVLDKTNAFDKASQGYIIIRPVPKAFTYRVSKK